MKTITFGMVGGGPDAMIGKAHRMALRLDGRAQLVAGCFSSSPAKSHLFGSALNLDPSRCYSDYLEMAHSECAREDRIDFVVIVTPNDSHFEICKAFLEAGIHIVCDKPLTLTYSQAQELVNLAAAQRLLFMVTYVYTGYVTFKQMRSLIRNGTIGSVRTVLAEYPQGWLHDETNDGGKQGIWRMDPSHSGRVNCLGDLGTHVENAVWLATGLRIQRLLAKMDKLVPGRVLDDNDQVLVEYENGATGIYWTSQVAVGCCNSLRLRIYGSKGSISWFQEEPESLTLMMEDGVKQVFCRGSSAIAPDVAQYARMPSGHPEGWLEALGNLYRNFVSCIQAIYEDKFTESMIDYPTVEDGAQGIAFIEACLKSQDQGNAWVEMDRIKGD